jgi:uncharacterized protein (DUF58 family)
MDTGFRQRAARLRQRWQQQLANRQARWLERRVPAVAQLQLGQRIIFILPTWQGLLCAVGALVLMVVAIAERNPVALLLAVLMLSLFLLSLVLCYRNLSGLQLRAARSDTDSALLRCFMGDQAAFTLTLQAVGNARCHQDLQLGFSEDALQSLSVPPGARLSITLKAPALQRGLMSAPRLTLRTTYPSGLWQAWSRPDLAMRCLVYPRPQICVLPSAALQIADTLAAQQQTLWHNGVDDFAGLRAYQTGDSLRRIAWQSLARGSGLQSKHFVSEAEPQILLNAAHFSHLPLEEALSCLCFLVLQLSSKHRRLGLQLPGQATIPPGQGEAHKHTLLQALALWE